MNEFHEIAAVVISEEHRMRELVRDRFGASIVAEVFEPLTSAAQNLASVYDEAERGIPTADRLVEEARAFGGVGSR